MRSLPLFHTISGKPVIVLGQGDAAEAKRRLVRRAGGKVVDDGNTEARLAFVALLDPEEVAARLKERGLLVNVTDRPDLCDFTVPSILDRDPVLVAVGTGGASAGLAKQLRLRLETLLPRSLGTLAAALDAARGRLRAQFPDAADRRRALDAALAPGGPLDPLADASAGAIESWLSGEPDLGEDGHLLLSLITKDPDDLTLRQARLLGMADVLLIGPGVPDAILARARADAVRRYPPFEGPVPSGLVIELRFVGED